MNNIAFYVGNMCVTWHGILMGLGVLAAILSAVTLRKFQDKPVMPILISCAIAVAIVPLCSRLVYWYCSHEQFKSLFSALTSFGIGGHSIIGAIWGILITGLLAQLLTKGSNPGQTAGELYDCLLPSGVIGTAIGRLAGLYDTADKGKVIVTDPKYQKLPFSVPVADVFSGETSYRLAVFLFESVAAFIIYFICLAVFKNVISEKGRFETGAAGCCALVFFCAAQCVFDSMKYDALFLRSNGFVCLMQIFGIGVMLFGVIYNAIKASHGALRGRDTAMMIIGCVFFLGNAGYMEYYVQRHGNLYLSCYAVMFTSLIGICLITVLLLGSRTKASR